MERKELLALYEGLRVADIADAMEACGHRNIGSVSQKILPMWQDFENCKHRICGFAFTVRFLPTNKVLQLNSSDEYKSKAESFVADYANCHRDMSAIGVGDVLVFDCNDINDWGGFGSLFALFMMKAKVRGMVTNNSMRDVDEIAKIKFPIYGKQPAKGHRCFRSEYDGCNVRINLGGALVCPGDMVVADSDGVIIVPIELAEAVGKYAHSVLGDDRELIKSQGLDKFLEK